MEWKRWVSQHGSVISMGERGALMWRSKRHPLVSLEWCLHMEVGWRIPCGGGIEMEGLMLWRKVAAPTNGLVGKKAQ